ncbi:MAG: succinate dehydrogenase cytochrome b subunit [Myxococcales bacterium FL481]|nr:MAG: succinate dehydrogenase cytochrome b subunit [Myxococcales bacterium FL481]
MTNASGALAPNRASSLFRSTIGAKVLMAVTGGIWVGWLVLHMLGNLQVFAGRETFNAYAALLKGMPGLLWGLRIVMLAAFVTHVALAVSLSNRNRDARPHAYVRKRESRTTPAGRFMLLSGLGTLAFIVYHLLHFTLGVTNPDHFQMVDAQGRHDAYGMLVRGFQTPAIAAAYLVAMAALSMHLSHAITSMLNTLGITTDAKPRLAMIGPVVTTILIVGNLVIVLGVWLNLQPDPGVISP